MIRAGLQKVERAPCDYKKVVGGTQSKRINQSINQPSNQANKEKTLENELISAAVVGTLQEATI